MARRKGVGSILFKRLITEAEGRGYQSLRITTGYSNEAMRALAHKFGANLTFRQGELTGSIDLEKKNQSDVAKPGGATPIDAARAIVKFNRTWWASCWECTAGARRHKPHIRIDKRARFFRARFH